MLRTSPNPKNQCGAITGGQAITQDLGLKLENVTLDDLGSAKRISITKDNSTIIDGAGAKADGHSHEKFSKPKNH